MTIYMLVTALCALPIFIRALCIVTRTTRERWPVWQLAGFKLGACLMGVSAVAVPLDRPWAAHALLAGVAALIVFDRRRRRRKER